jgi:flavin-dependent dehydrogenase
MTDASVFDVLVIGGGPAGATAAALLASWGRSVVVAHCEGDSPSLAESLPASTKKLLRHVGLLDVIEASRFHPNGGNISRWAGREAVAEPAESGYHVPRARFDRLLRDHARACGATLVEGRVRKVELANPATIECVGPPVRRCYRSRFVLDCSGRAGVIASRGLRRAHIGYRTLALTAEWDCAGWPAGERAHTLVDSYADGWAWSVPLSPARRQCTVMIDAERTAIRKASLAEVYSQELRKALSISSRLTGARQEGQPWACDASLYDCVRSFDGHALLVGDAASFVEPLSSGGVKKALSSAWRAAVVVNTCLNEPGMLTAAAEFHDRRERHVFDEYQRRSTAFFQEAAQVYDDRFWSARASGDAGRPDASAGDLTDAEVSADAGVRSAFERLRNASTFRLARGPSLRFEKIAVIEGRLIVMREGVVVPGVESPVRFVAGVNLPDAIRIAASSRDVASFIEAYHRQVGRIDPRNLLTGLSLLVARGLLEALS